MCSLMPTSPVFGFMYQCHESEPLSTERIAAILDVSRRNNARKGITGMLLYRNGRFLQVLEGAREPVLELVQTIRKDPRQKSFTVLYESEWPRLFHEWSMDFRMLQETRSNGQRAMATKQMDAQLADVLTRAPLRVRKRLVTFAAGS